MIIWPRAWEEKFFSTGLEARLMPAGFGRRLPNLIGAQPSESNRCRFNLDKAAAGLSETVFSPKPATVPTFQLCWKSGSRLATLCRDVGIGSRSRSGRIL